MQTQRIHVGTPGSDAFVFQDGPDIADGGPGEDLVDLSSETESVVVTLNGSNESVVYIGGRAEDVTRNVEMILSGSGNDILTGDDGMNGFRGGVGHDGLDGRGGFDLVDYTDKDAPVHVTLAGPNQWGMVHVGGVAEDIIRNIEVVSGSNAADRMIGNNQFNWFMGRAGDDYLAGRGGPDLLMGGGGADTFAYFDVTDSTPEYPDTLTDFSVADRDTIDVSHIDADQGREGVQSLAFSATAAPHSVWVQILGRVSGDDTSPSTASSEDPNPYHSFYVLADVNGDTEADFLIRAGDFLQIPLNLL